MKVKIIKDITVLEVMPALVQSDDLDLTLNFRHDNNNYFDLSDYDEVRFKARLTNESITKINKEVTVSTGTSGVAVLSFNSSDLASSGVYFTEISCSSSSEIRSVSLGNLYVQEEL